MNRHVCCIPRRVQFILGGCLVLAAALAGCASDPPGSSESVRLRGPTISTLFWPSVQGRTIQLRATVESNGSVVAALRVLVTGDDGNSGAEPPIVSGAGEFSPVESVNGDGNMALVKFREPGLTDGSTVDLDVTVPESAPSPFRIRLLPVLRAPSDR